MLKKIGLPGLAIGGLILYFLLKPKAPAPQVAAPRAPVAPAPGKPSAMQACIDNPSLANCTGAATGMLDALAKEFTGMDGMIPSSLEGHMASIGAYNGLGGSFYGGY